MILLTTFEEKSTAEIGGKAANLLDLEKIGANVPSWVVVPASVFESHLETGNSASLADGVVLAELEKSLLTHFGQKAAEMQFAVRSSAVGEDGGAFSFAGQFETFLHVPIAEVAEKVKAIWISSNSERLKIYRQQHNLPQKQAVAVIIQEMVEADVAGVAFGADPVSGDSSQHVISAVFGLGEGLVSGELDADTYTISKAEKTEQIALKTHFFAKSSNGFGVEKYPLEEKKQQTSTLNDSQINEISALLAQLQTALGAPQDIEFAYKNNELFLLQTRPITTLKKPAEGEYMIWDNSNIVESYPGITTPLTFSFIEKMYEFVYRQLVGIFGVNKQEIEQHADVFANTLGLVRGRVYYNLLSWYKMLAMVPGYSINAESMERMMGVKERFELSENYQLSKSVARIRVAKMAFKMIKTHFALPKEHAHFMAHLNDVMKKYQAIDFEKCTPQEIIDHYKTFESSLLLEWKAPLINDFFAMVWFGMLHKLCEKHMPNETNIHNDLLCGSQDIISVEPIHRSMAIAKAVSENAEVKVLFVEKSAAQIWQTLLGGAHPEIKQMIDDYINRFGDRCVGELKLETVSYAHNPALFVKVIQSYVLQGIVEVKNKGSIEEKIRSEAEQKRANAFKGKALKNAWFSYVLRNTRRLVSNRENLRFERTRGFGMVRNMFRALGKQWKEAGFLLDESDVFYLKLEEIKNMGAEFDRSLLLKIEERKAEFAAYRLQEIPQERFFTYGYNFTDEYIYSLEKVEGAVEELKGIGCCPGIVKGKVRVVANPSEVDSLNGDILVTSSTDPGWVTLFPSASAIIVERGSLLSHSAIVSRELGIPCIVSVTGLLRTLKTGDVVVMNGSTGSIKKMENE